MSNKLTSNAPIIAIIVTTLVWTITWVVSKHAMQYMGPFDFAAWRFGLGTLTLFVVLLIGTVLLVGLLNYVPALALGPVVEHLMLVAR